MLDADVIVIGAGPVGMLAALLSAQQGLRVLLLEQEPVRQLQSRAIGITPPSLEILRSIGLSEAFIEQGVAVRVSEAFGRGMRLGRIDFSGLQGDFRFVLSIPQDRTESLLEEAILTQPSIRFLYGHRATSCTVGEGTASVSGELAGGGIFRFCGRCLMACDGGRSSMREALGIPFDGSQDRHTFLMGDFEDITGWEGRVRLFFTRRGSVESFPLPQGRRRFVVRTPFFISEYSGDYLKKEILWRTGADVGNAGQFWESGYGVKNYTARTFCKGPVFLCGDAAHLMSAVGGQNMNTGFADAELAAWFSKLLIDERVSPPLVERFYDRVRRRAASAAARRASWLMLLGTSGGRIWSPLRNLATFIFLHTPIQRVLIRLFSMQSIPCRNLEHCREIYEKELGL